MHLTKHIRTERQLDVSVHAITRDNPDDGIGILLVTTGPGMSHTTHLEVAELHALADAISEVCDQLNAVDLTVAVPA